MCFITKRCYGFTLFELLVALVISSIIMIGIFEVFKNVLDTQEYTEKKGNHIELISKLVSLIDSDIYCKIGPFKVQNTGNYKKLSFTTTHSLLFGDSLPVEVSYCLEKQENKFSFVREEREDWSGRELKIPLTNIFDKWNFKFYRQGEWVDSVSSIIMIILMSKKEKFSFVCRGIM